MNIDPRMKISVAIATYNRAAMVGQAVEAALAQSRPPDEVVVADDASTDGTREALAPLAAADPRVRLLGRDKNSGGVENWNTAMTATRGDLIAWCSDDDRFLPGHLEAAHAYLAAHPEVGLVHAGFVDALEFADGVSRTEPRPLRSQRPLMVHRGNLFPYLIRYYDWPFHPSTIVMRREVWERTGPFDPAYALADTDWFVRAAEQFPVAWLPRHGVLNRRHGGNWSNQVGSARMQLEIFAIVDRAMLRRWPAPSLQRMLWRAVWRANVCLRLGLTIWARIRSGHAEAACAAWQSLVRLMGLGLIGKPSAGVPSTEVPSTEVPSTEVPSTMTRPSGRGWSHRFDRLGQSVIRRCAGRYPLPAEARQSLSPF